MATPLKPWEIRGAASQSGEASRTASSRPGTGNSPPPTIPPRSAGSSYSPYSTTRYINPSYQGLGSYGYGGYGGYGGYRPFGGMYGGYGGPGYGPYAEGESQIVRQAEESTRAAFQSVESVVGAFASVSMMLESTYVAVHSCFRAVLGVAQHFTRLKNHIWSIVAAVALLRRLRYWLKRLLRMLQLRHSGITEEAWDEASLEQHSVQLAEMSRVAQGNSRVWPIVAFLVIVLGVPWLLWRLLSSLVEREQSVESEAAAASSGDSQPLVARALYGFTAERNGELSFSVGDEMVLAPRQLQSGWLLAGRNRRSGLVPANYVQILSPAGANPRQSNAATPHPSSSTEDPRPVAQDLFSQEESLLTD